MEKNKTQQESLNDIGKNAFAAIAEMVARLEKAEFDDNENEIEASRDAICEDPLSLQVRSGWHAPGCDSSPEEFNLLLGTGGPAVRIIGELDQYGEPYSARLETQDWGTPWTEYREADEAILLTYARQFVYTV